MSRIKVLRANPRRALAAMATLLIAVGVTAASGANFTAQKANAGNVLTAGSIDIGNTPGGAILTAGNLKPGDVTAGEVEIENTGTLSGAFTLDKGALTDNGKSLAGHLNLKVIDCGPDLDCSLIADNVATPVYDGTLQGMGSGYALGNFAAGEKHRYEFTATLSNSTPNTLQGGESTVEFVWNAAA